TVLQSADLAAVVVFVAEAGFSAAVVPFAAAGLGAQTPSTVITAALAGTEADVSGGGACFCGGAIFPGAGGGVPGAACPQAIVPNRTHINQPLRIYFSPPGLVHQRLKITKQEILAQAVALYVSRVTGFSG